MKILKFLLSFALWSLMLVVSFSCSQESEEITNIEDEKWSIKAPYQPNVADIKSKISSVRMNGGYPIPSSLENPSFIGFDDEQLLQSTAQALSESGLAADRIDALLEFYQDTAFQRKVNMDPNTGRILITSVTHSNEVVESVSEAVFSMLDEHLNRLIITDDFPNNANVASSFVTPDRTMYSSASLFKGSNGEDMRADLFNETTEISYLVSGITPPSQNAQILQLVLQTLYIMHDHRAFLDEQNSGSIANIGIRDNLASLFLTLYRPTDEQEAILNGRYFNHPDAVIPQDNPNTTDFDESEVNTLYEVIERTRQTAYSNLANDPYQPVPEWLARQYETLTGAPMPNGHFADWDAIELAIEACNTFLDNRPAARDFIINYYGVDY
jgi:hypothetical protein